jgi:K(+)-stimulated pyrophosphate-energized sodium pump
LLQPIIYIFPVIGIIGLFVSLTLYREVMKSDPGTPEIIKYSKTIRSGAFTFLKREYLTMLIFAVIFAVIIAFTLNIYVMFCFIIGAITSALAALIGMNMATNANGRTTFAARTSQSKALNTAISGGSVMGITAVSIGILGISSMYILFSHLNFAEPLEIITGFSIGASFTAIFDRIGGGIYTKAADVGADLVGKTEIGIPEDDPRNPAVIADNVGDNVGDINGMGSDTYQAYTDTTIASLIIGSIVAVQGIKGNMLGEKAIIFPLIVVATGIISSIIGIYTIKILLKYKQPIMENILLVGFLTTWVLSVIGVFIFAKFYLNYIGAFYSTIAGLTAGVLIGFSTIYYTLRRPTRLISDSTVTGPATTIITGLSVGLESAFIPMILLSLSMLISYYFAGIYGVSLSGVGLLSILGITLSLDAYGPIADNAGGIAEMTKQEPQVREITDRLDMFGNTTAAIAKAFAVGATAAAALSLITAYAEKAGIGILGHLDIRRPDVMAGILIGSVFPALLSSIALKEVGKSAKLMVEEVRRQFKEIPGLTEGKAEPDYNRCIDISTRGALKRMILPSIISLSAPFIIAFILGKEALAGFLTGCMATGIFLAIFMANVGGAWDNAKKLIEAGRHGGKGSEAHKASVIGDTVGDPLKDTAGPSLNIIIELVAAISLAFVPLF